jgi:hypothetical protein
VGGAPAGRGAAAQGTWPQGWNQGMPTGQGTNCVEGTGARSSLNKQAGCRCWPARTGAWGARSGAAYRERLDRIQGRPPTLAPGGAGSDLFGCEGKAWSSARARARARLRGHIRSIHQCPMGRPKARAGGACMQDEGCGVARAGRSPYPRPPPAPRPRVRSGEGRPALKRHVQATGGRRGERREGQWAGRRENP